MINRRHIRVKVMQSVYAMIKSHDDDIVKAVSYTHLTLPTIYSV